MNKHGPLALAAPADRAALDGLGGLLVGRDALEIDRELGRVVLGEREHLGAVQREDVVGNVLWRLGEKVGVVDAEGSGVIGWG